MSKNSDTETYTGNYQVGDHVEYHPVPGRALNTTEGEIVDVATSKEPVGPGGQKVNASPDDPRYVIRNDNTGKETGYREKHITGRAE
ncbi:hypothetical protein GYMLUDRAFT_41694 [Collybiopsis luxurians FD-317 M1]|uniref:Hypervirulence associated protein TUDOR domain-containing protein n=1 Tax=Collybiopsis luxurians FD-317 M1 TaxID=944289 RepID=A0A0D0CJ72_9AGAR|nr:hypothetical protein GYMLUDRAFT_41694 [Collybiopsis luxurians FD-317 M1]